MVAGSLTRSNLPTTSHGRQLFGGRSTNSVTSEPVTMELNLLNLNRKSRIALSFKKCNWNSKLFKKFKSSQVQDHLNFWQAKLNFEILKFLKI